jgi:hypothetical protein
VVWVLSDKLSNMVGHNRQTLLLNENTKEPFIGQFKGGTVHLSESGAVNEKQVVDGFSAMTVVHCKTLSSYQRPGNHA